ncbi:proline-rich receptor-like protein kinase PERK8 [Gracilaria domingensis]|nr:proline-rich receptor-like protein kinase PERK8 [Gracilaria domingensis]
MRAACTRAEPLGGEVAHYEPAGGLGKDALDISGADDCEGVEQVVTEALAGLVVEHMGLAIGADEVLETEGGGGGDDGIGGGGEAEEGGGVVWVGGAVGEKRLCGGAVGGGIGEGGGKRVGKRLDVGGHLGGLREGGWRRGGQE